MQIKKGRLATLIVAMAVAIGNVASVIYGLINNDFGIFGLILDILMTLVMVNVIFDCFEKKEK